jgi:zinc/manganese transport system substrate-binding protein
LNIVAAENFWGSIVSQLAGKAGSVTSIVTDPNADPHSFESSTDDARAFAEADYVVLNGAGYDGWAEKLLSGNPNPRRSVLNVATLLGKKAGDNPHFWYDPDAVSALEDRVEADLKSIDPADSAYFDTRRQALDDAMAPLRARLAAIKDRFAGSPVASTESIFVYLGSYLGLRVISPPAFMDAVAEGNDPPAPAVTAFEDELTRKQVDLLVYNQQTATAVTANMRKLAAKEGIPTVGVTETVEPAGATFETWFEAELERLEGALTATAASRPAGSQPSTTVP